MNLRAVAASALLFAFAAPSAAFAYPIFDVTASEVLSVDPPRVKTTFTIVETGYVPDGWCPWSAFDVSAQDPDATDAVEFFACDGPPEGHCALLEYGGAQMVSFSPGHFPASTYSIVTDRTAPCVLIQFSCVTLMGAVPPLETCMLVDMPVPANPTSWGALKSIYR